MSAPRGIPTNTQRCPVVSGDALPPGLGKSGTQGSWRSISFIGLVVSLTLAFSSHFLLLFIHAANSELHSYILFVPFLTAYLFFIRRRQMPKDYRSSLGSAVIPFIIAVAALGVIGISRVSKFELSHNDFLGIIAFSFVLFLAAGGFLFLGKKWMAASAFPFVFLIFLVPLPDFAVNFLETASKLASAEIANLFFKLTGTPALRDGTVFALPGITIQVAQECSGIRSSWVLFITSLLAAHLFLNKPGHRALLVAAVVPLGILRNGLRILVIALLCVHISPDMIDSVFHKRGGPVFFALSLIPLGLLLWWLRRHEGRVLYRRNSTPTELRSDPAKA